MWGSILGENGHEIEQTALPHILGCHQPGDGSISSHVRAITDFG